MPLEGNSARTLISDPRLWHTPENWGDMVVSVEATDSGRARYEQLS